MDGPDRDTLTGAVGDVRQCDQHVRESVDIDVHRSAAPIVLQCWIYEPVKLGPMAFCTAGSLRMLSNDPET